MKKKKPGYDDPYVRKDEERMNRHLKQLKKFRESFTPEKKKLLEKAISALAEQVSQLKEKAKYEGLTAEEKQMLKDGKKQQHTLLQGISDTLLILGEKKFHCANTRMEQIKEKADGGDERAKKIYGELHESYKKSLKELCGNKN